jgi:hypothetical protein
MKQFVSSLRSTGYQGEIVLGTKEQITRELKTELERHCVVAMPVHDAHADNVEAKGNTMPIASRRFLLYEQWIKELDYSPQTTIFITDVRDTLFQLPPFGGVAIKDDQILLFGDSHPLTSFHSMMGECFDKPRGTVEALVKKMGPTALTLCSGTTISTVQGLTRYFAAMKAEFNKYQCWPHKGIDQGYHNWCYVCSAIRACMYARLSPFHSAFSLTHHS